MDLQRASKFKSTPAGTRRMEIDTSASNHAFFFFFLFFFLLFFLSFSFLFFFKTLRLKG